MLWGHYEAELRAKLRERERRWGILPATRSWRPTATRSRRPATTWSGRSAATWSWSPALRIALAASAAGIILVFALDAGDRARIHAPDPIALEQTVIGSQLDLLQNYDLVERLDLLEDLDVIRQLDRDG
jgi:anti-sigma-K factor RskA